MVLSSAGGYSTFQRGRGTGPNTVPPSRRKPPPSSQCRRTPPRSSLWDDVTSSRACEGSRYNPLHPEILSEAKDLRLRMRRIVDSSAAPRDDIAASTGGLRRLRRPLAERDRDVHALTVAQDGERGLVAGVLVVLDIAPQVAAGRYRLAIDGHNDVAAGRKDLVADADALRTRLYAGLLRASRHHLHQQSLLIGRKAELLLDLRTQIG